MRAACQRQPRCGRMQATDYSGLDARAVWGAGGTPLAVAGRAGRTSAAWGERLRRLRPYRATGAFGAELNAGRLGEPLLKRGKRGAVPTGGTAPLF